MVDNNELLVVTSSVLIAAGLVNLREITLRLQLWHSSRHVIRHLLNTYGYELSYRNVPYDYRHCWSENRAKVIVVNTALAKADFIEYTLKVIFLKHVYTQE